MTLPRRKRAWQCSKFEYNWYLPITFEAELISIAGHLTNQFAFRSKMVSIFVIDALS